MGEVLGTAIPCTFHWETRVEASRLEMVTTACQEVGD